MGDEPWGWTQVRWSWSAIDVVFTGMIFDKRIAVSLNRSSRWTSIVEIIWTNVSCPTTVFGIPTRQTVYFETGSLVDEHQDLPFIYTIPKTESCCMWDPYVKAGQTELMVCVHILDKHQPCFLSCLIVVLAKFATALLHLLLRFNTLFQYQTHFQAMKILIIKMKLSSGCLIL